MKQNTLWGARFFQGPNGIVFEMEGDVDGYNEETRKTQNRSRN